MVLTVSTVFTEKRVLKLAAAVGLLLTSVMHSAASASCRDDVAAAFERLKGQSHRIEITDSISSYQTATAVVEVVPPDRRREVTSNGVQGYAPHEIIWIGQQAWSQTEGIGPWRWTQWGAESVRKNPGSWGYYDTLIPEDAEFECLGEVRFDGRTLLGYHSRIVTRKIGVIVEPGANQEEIKQLAMRALAALPQESRLVYVDPVSGLPAYDLIAADGQPDRPRYKARYTYLRLRISRPFWCSLRMCPTSPLFP